MPLLNITREKSTLFLKMQTNISRELFTAIDCFLCHAAHVNQHNRAQPGGAKQLFMRHLKSIGVLMRDFVTFKRLSVYYR